MSKVFRVREIYRYSSRYYRKKLRPEQQPEYADGYLNYFFVADNPDGPLPLLDHGINPIRTTKASGQQRRPAILISSSPHKVGSIETPWQDLFNPDSGYIRYFGDNKDPSRNADEAPGNSLLINEFHKHQSPDPQERSQATPLFFFKRVKVEGNVKGYVQFQGFGLIERAELKTQIDVKTDKIFTNYQFQFLVMSLAKENEELNWNWINDRRNSDLDHGNTLSSAPESWLTWLSDGEKVKERIRRKASRILVVKTHLQRPAVGSNEEKILTQVYKFYEGRKHRFEALAAKVAENILRKSVGDNFLIGWLTPSTADGGADFIGRLDIGEGLSTAKMVVLGQAKCEKLDAPTGGNHIARTVARLKRGWLGIYVTTSYFSESVQREVIDDKYPIMLINGKKVAQEVFEMMIRDGYQTVNDLLIEVDSAYDETVSSQSPEEILLV